MDPVSAVASIVGIIGFAGTALKAISDLKDFCHEFSPDTTKDFLHDLEVMANLLTDVQALSEKAKRNSPTLHIDYRAEALSIQVDDCSRDLTKWLKIALRVKKERAGKKQNIKMQFFNSVLTAISKSSRASAREKLRWHQHNINTTLSLFGRHINLASSITLHSVDETVRQISRKMSDNAEELSKQVSSLSSSVSGSAGSLQAQNSSMFDRLDVLTDLLQQVISSNASQTSSINSGNIPEAHKKFKSPAAERQEDNVNADTSCGQDGDIILHRPQRQYTSYTAVSDENPGHPAEFDALFRATKSLVNSLHQICHPLIAELLSTMHALDALELQHRCLEMGSLANIWASAYDPQAGLHEVAQMERAAALQLLSVRKQCKFEGLGDTLELVMSKLGVSERDAEYWESLTKQEPTGQKLLQLGELRDPDSNEQRKDRLTRTNEWMLGVFYAFPYFIELHRKILILEEIELRESSKSSDIHQWKEDRWSLSETTQRTMVKFWFLDSAAMSEEEYATSHIPGSDSDATFRRLDEEIKIPDDMLSEAYEAEPDTERNTEIAEAEFKMMMSKKTAPILNLPSDPSQRVDVDEAGQVLPQEEIPHELPPDRISGKVLAAASRAVADYEQEPSRAFDD